MKKTYNQIFQFEGLSVHGINEADGAKYAAIMDHENKVRVYELGLHIEDIQKALPGRKYYRITIEQSDETF